MLTWQVPGRWLHVSLQVLFKGVKTWRTLSIILAQVHDGGFYFVCNPGTAETLDMNDEGETCGLLERNKENMVHPGCACSIKETPEARHGPAGRGRRAAPGRRSLRTPLSAGRDIDIDIYIYIYVYIYIYI